MTAEELQKLLNVATPGPWLATYSNYGEEIWFGGEGCGMWEVGPAYLGGNGNATALKATMDADARLIALAPTLARKVIAAENLVEALQVARDNEDIEGMFFALAAWEARE